MHSDIPTLAEAFKNAGYITKSYSTNALLDPELGLMRGFDEAIATSDEARTMSLALEALNTPHSSPLFLFVNLMSAHAPYLIADFVPWSAKHRSDFDINTTTLEWAKPYIFTEYPGLNLTYFQEGNINGEMLYSKGALNIPKTDLLKIEDLYDGELMRLNIMMSSLMKAWNGRNGIVAVTSDHGEYLGENKRIGHGADLHPSVLSVPLIVAYPGQLEAGVRKKAPVEMRRLGATVLDLARIDTTSKSLAKKHSLFEESSDPIMAGVWGFSDWAKQVDPVYGIQKRWVQKNNYVAIVDEQGNGSMFNLSTDPTLERNISKEEHLMFEDLKNTALLHMSKPSVEANFTADEELLQQKLRSLGYMDD